MLRIVDAGVRHGIFLARPVAVLDAPNASRIMAEAGGDLNLARSINGGPSRPLVEARGRQATGGTIAARVPAGQIGFVHQSSDVVRKKMPALRVTEHRFEGFAPGLSTRTSSRTCAALRHRATRYAVGF